MRNLLILLIVVLPVMLVGCSDTPEIVNEGDIIYEFDDELYYTKDEMDDMFEAWMEVFDHEVIINFCNYKITYRVVVDSEIGEGVYIVEKYGYTTSQAWQMASERELVLGEQLWIAVYENDAVIPLEELVCTEASEEE